MILEDPPTLEVFYEACEESWESNPYINVVLGNLENLVEHATAMPWSGQLDMDAYRNSREYRIAQIDLGILNTASTDQEPELLLQKRKKLVKEMLI